MFLEVDRTVGLARLLEAVKAEVIDKALVRGASHRFLPAYDSGIILVLKPVLDVFLAVDLYQPTVAQHCNIAVAD